MYVCPEYVNEPHMHACSTHSGQERALHPLKQVSVKRSCEPYPGPSQARQVLLMTKPSLWPLQILFRMKERIVC